MACCGVSDVSYVAADFADKAMTVVCMNDSGTKYFRVEFEHA